MTNLLQMRTKMSVFRRLLWIALVMLVLMPQANAAQARTIVDMTGRTVEIPDVVNKIFGASPPTLYLLYAMAPETIAGWNFPIRDNEKKHLRKDMLDLPVIGGWFGQGRTPNIEHVMAVKPDFMLVWYMKDTAASQLVEQTAETMHLPIVYVRLETLEDYARTFRFLGDLLGRQERGNELADYTERVLAEVAPIVNGVPEQDRIPVYYAEYLDGLKTECDKSPHAVLIEMAGGRNVNECESKSAYGMESISIEEVINKQPQVIVAQETEFLKTVYDAPQWNLVPAVKNKRVYAIPRVPFNWFDRPPSFMRILGLQWLASILYPKQYPKDMMEATRDFYRLFLQTELTDAEIRDVLYP